MASINSTTRILTAPVLVLALLFSGFAMPANGATASPSKCCKAEVTTDCYGMPCCDVRAPRQDQPQPVQSRPSNDRPSDGKTIWIDYVSGQADLRRSTQVELFSGAPTSGSPSLIAQHVRLQI